MTTQRTQIVDKNNKVTHVHKNTDSGTQGTKRGLPTAPVIDQTSDIARLIPGNPVEDANNKKGSALDTQQSRLVTGASKISTVEVWGDSGDIMVSASFDGVNLSRIIASEIDSNPSEDAVNEVTANIADNLVTLEEALMGYGIEVDDIHADVQTWTYSFPLDEDSEVSSWAGVASQIDGEGGVAVLNNFVSMEPDGALRDAVWEALGL